MLEDQDNPAVFSITFAVGGAVAIQRYRLQSRDDGKGGRSHEDTRRIMQRRWIADTILAETFQNCR